MIRKLGLCAGWAAALFTGSCSDQAGATEQSSDSRLYAYVTNGPASFWVIAGNGAEAAGRDLGVRVILLTPRNVVEQKNTVEDMVTRGVDGIAVSPIDPDNQTAMIDRAAERTIVITHDSDAPNSKRRCFIGVDNYVAGRMCGELVKQALPEGGEIMIFVGRTEQDNARRRRQGLIDMVLDRSPDPERRDPVDRVVGNERYKFLGTFTDQFDPTTAKDNVEDALIGHPEIDCMVGLFAYNTPAILEALKRADKLGQVVVVSFDEDDVTLQGIVEGVVFGTVVQDPYAYGYRSVELLDQLARGDESAIPANGFIEIPARKIMPGNVEVFWAELRRKLAGGDGK